MARVFQKSRGGGKVTARWYIEIADHRGKRHQIAGEKSEATTRSYALKLSRIIDLRKAGDPIEPQLLRWLETMAPIRFAENLSEWGVLTVSAGDLLLDGMIEPWRDHLIASGLTVKHGQAQAARARRMMVEMQALVWSDLTIAKAERAVARLWVAGMSGRTINGHIQATKQFVDWAATRSGRTPTEIMRFKPVKSQVQAPHRPLTMEELGRLLKASPPERAFLYEFAAFTGLRQNECRMLLVSDIREGMVVVRSASAKSRKEQYVPLRRDLAAKLAGWTRMKAPTARLFSMGSGWACAKYWRIDCEAAGIEREDATGRVATFHSLRKTFVTELARAGVPAKTVQKLARHASITTTMNVYAFSYVADERDAVEALKAIAVEPVKVNAQECG